MTITTKFNPCQRVAIIRDNKVHYGRVEEVMTTSRDAGQTNQYVTEIMYKLSIEPGTSMTGQLIVHEYECFKDADDFRESMEKIAQVIKNND